MSNLKVYDNLYFNLAQSTYEGRPNDFKSRLEDVDDANSFSIINFS